MNFNLDKEQTFARALKPNEIKTETKDWSTIEGYVYVISKVFPPHENDAPLNLVKVGYSNVTTKEKFDKGYTRLLGFRTSLISFKVHRIYLFEASPFDKGVKEPKGFNANMAEQLLHRLIDDKFKPPQVRMQFSNGAKTEWWNVKEKQMEKFLDFCDKKVQLDTRIPPIYGTRFTRNKSYPIKFPHRVMATIGYVDVTGSAKEKKKKRDVNNQFAKSERVRRTTIAVMKAIQADKEMKGAKRRELEKTVPFWKNLLLNKTFTDKKMHPEDKGYFKGKRIIDSVFKPKSEQIYVGYGPDIRTAAKTGGDKKKQEQIDDASGYLTINETLDYFPALKKKYQASYDYYVKKNKFESDFDYTETFS